MSSSSSLHAASDASHPIMSRRSLLLESITTTLIASSTTVITGVYRYPAANAVEVVQEVVSTTTEPTTTTTATTTPTRALFALGQDMSIDDAKDRFRLARQELLYLIEHFDTVLAEGGGDNVRRYLGTVGVTSAMYGITKVMKRLQDEADDIVEYTESMNEFDYSLRAADTACYSANFVEFSAAKTKPKAFFEDAFLDAERMIVAMEIMAKELKL